MFSLKNFIKYCLPEWLPFFEHHKQQFLVKAKATIFAEGEKVAGIYFVEKGYVKVFSNEKENHQKIIRLVGDEMFLGHRGINTTVFPVSAAALVDTTLVFIPMNVFMKIIKANAELSVLLIQFLSGELRETEERIKNLMILNPRQMIASIFLKLIDSFGFDQKNSKKMAYPISRSDIADMAGLTYETVIRTLTVFEKNKLIAMEGKEFEIVSRTKLSKVVLGKMELI